MPKGRGFPGRTLRTRHAHPKGRRCDRLTRSLDSWLSSPLHRRRFPQALRYEGSLAHSEPERHSSPGLKSGVFWRRMITIPRTRPFRLTSRSWRQRSAGISISLGCMYMLREIRRSRCITPFCGCSRASSTLADSARWSASRFLALSDPNPALHLLEGNLVADSAPTATPGPRRGTAPDPSARGRQTEHQVMVLWRCRLDRVPQRADLACHAAAGSICRTPNASGMGVG